MILLHLPSLCNLSTSCQITPKSVFREGVEIHLKILHSPWHCQKCTPTSGRCYMFKGTKGCWCNNMDNKMRKNCTSKLEMVSTKEIFCLQSATIHHNRHQESLKTNIVHIRQTPQCEHKPLCYIDIALAVTGFARL